MGEGAALELHRAPSISREVDAPGVVPPSLSQGAGCDADLSSPSTVQGRPGERARTTKVAPCPGDAVRLRAGSNRRVAPGATSSGMRTTVGVGASKVR